MDSKVAGSQCLLQLAFNRGQLQDLVEIVDVENLHRLGSILSLLPVVVVDLLDKLVARIVAHLLEQLAEQMGQQSTSRDHTLVGVRIAVIQCNLSLVGQKQPTHHAGRQQCLACVMDVQRHILTCELYVREIFTPKELANIGTLVLLVGSVLEMVGEVGDGLLLSKDPKLGAIAEARCQKLDVGGLKASPDQRGNCGV